MKDEYWLIRSCFLRFEWAALSGYFAAAALRPSSVSHGSPELYGRHDARCGSHVLWHSNRHSSVSLLAPAVLSCARRSPRIHANTQPRAQIARTGQSRAGRQTESD